MTADRDAFDNALAEIAAAAELAETAGDFAALHGAFIAAVSQCERGSDLWRIALIEPNDEAFFSEEELVPAELEAILDCARRWGGADDIAAALAFACRATATHPGRQLIAADEGGEKEALAAVLDEHIADVRAAIDSPHASVRVAGLHALGCCRIASVDDARRAEQIAIDDAHATVVATALLAIAAITRRESDVERIAAVLGNGRLGDASPLVRLCAIAAISAAGEVLQATAVEVLLDALEDPQPLPVEWGWRWHDDHEATDALAVRILRNALVEPESRARVTTALVRVAARSPIHLLADAALRIAFGEPFVPPERGVVLEELDAAQRDAMRTLGPEERLTVHALGLHLVQDVEPFLAGTDGAWTPIAVVRDGVTRRWHLWRIWREVVAGDMGDAEAAAIVADALAPEAIVAALCSERRRAIVAVCGFEPSARERDLVFLLRICEAVRARGTDLAALGAAQAVASHVDRAALAIVLLVGFRELLPAALDPVVARGIAFLDDAFTIPLVDPLGASRARSLRAAAIQVLVDARAYGDAVTKLRAAADHDVDLLLDAIGIAERGATAARTGRAGDAALDLLRLAHLGYEIWASMSTSGAEGMQRMLDVNRVAAQIGSWERELGRPQG